MKGYQEAKDQSGGAVGESTRMGQTTTVWLMGKDT